MEERQIHMIDKTETDLKIVKAWIEDIGTRFVDEFEVRFDPLINNESERLTISCSRSRDDSESHDTVRARIATLKNSLRTTAEFWARRIGYKIDWVGMSDVNTEPRYLSGETAAHQKRIEEKVFRPEVLVTENIMLRKCVRWFLENNAERSGKPLSECIKEWEIHSDLGLLDSAKLLLHAARLCGVFESSDAKKEANS